MSRSNVPIAVLYHCTPGSIWSAVPVLTALEKGFDQTKLEQRFVNLVEGQNFSPAYLKISPKGTIPALVAPFEHTTGPSTETKFKSFTDTTSICQFLDASTLGFGNPSTNSSINSPSLSPATVQGSSESKAIIERLHDLELGPDPNRLLMSFRNDEERKLKWGGGASAFLLGRQRALIKYRKEGEVEEDPNLNRFYDYKIKENDALIAIFQGKADATEFIQKTRDHWIALGRTVEFLEAQLSSTYLIGDQVSLADLHAGAFFARVFTASGAKSLDVPSGIKALNAQIGSVEVGPKLTGWLEALFARESFKKVYGGGCH